MKKPIKIESTELIAKAIQEAEGKARQRLLAPADIPHYIKQVESRLTLLGIPKKHWRGIWFTVSPDKLPRSYKHRAEGTYAEFEYLNGWRLRRVFRTTCAKTAYGARGDINLYVEVAREHIQTNITL